MTLASVIATGRDARRWRALGMSRESTALA